MIHEADKGTNFYQAVKELKEIMTQKGLIEAQLLFNDIYIWVNRDSIIDDIATIYDLKRELLRYKL
jgi:hypothetical protein